MSADILLLHRGESSSPAVIERFPAVLFTVGAGIGRSVSVCRMGEGGGADGSCRSWRPRRGFYAVVPPQCATTGAPLTAAS